MSPVLPMVRAMVRGGTYIKNAYKEHICKEHIGSTLQRDRGHRLVDMSYADVQCAIHTQQYM